MCDDKLTQEVASSEVSSPSRRGFFAKVLGVLAVTLALPRLAFAKKVAIPMVDPLKTVGGTATLKIKDKKILFVRESETSIKAVDAICTHKNCTVKYTASDGQIHCPCHKSAYKLDGTKLSGPAPRGLIPIPASIDGEQIVITLPDEAPAEQK